MLKTGDKCPICGEGKLSENIIKEEFEYKGKKILISDYHIFKCNDCKEEIVSPKTIKETEKVLTDFRRRVDGLLTSYEIKVIRKKLGKTQAQMAAFLGVGEKNFARYENGQVTQGKPMDSLLRILNHQPDILHKIKADFAPDNDYNYALIVKPSIVSAQLWGNLSLSYPVGKSNYELGMEELNAA